MELRLAIRQWCIWALVAGVVFLFFQFAAHASSGSAPRFLKAPRLKPHTEVRIEGAQGDETVLVPAPMSRFSFRYEGCELVLQDLQVKGGTYRLRHVRTLRFPSGVSYDANFPPTECS